MRQRLQGRSVIATDVAVAIASGCVSVGCFCWVVSIASILACACKGRLLAAGCIALRQLLAFVDTVDPDAAYLSSVSLAHHIILRNSVQLQPLLQRRIPSAERSEAGGMQLVEPYLSASAFPAGSCLDCLPGELETGACMCCPQAGTDLCWCL
jgi:hypothetical protein